MNSGKKINLGKRLHHIQSMVTEQYDHIWDCCCDHGLLGAALLERNAAPQIHFVDIVPELTRQLENKLSRFFPSTAESRSRWQVHCVDAAALPLVEVNGRHLVIIAGVGGDLTADIIRSIHQKNPTATIDFLLCPVHHQFTLRQQLIELDFSLKTEALIIENQRFYEILLVSMAGNSCFKIHLAGSLIWQYNTSDQAQIAAGYLQKTLDHYRRMQLNPSNDVQNIIATYDDVQIVRAN